MKKIWKYVIRTVTEDGDDILTKKPLVEMPLGAKVLRVDRQAGSVCIWAEVDVDQTKIERRHFVIYGTGDALTEPEETRKYIGTFFLNEGATVFHVFEIVQQEKYYTPTPERKAKKAEQ